MPSEAPQGGDTADEEEAALLAEMAIEAESYVLALRLQIMAMHLFFGIGGVVATFLLETGTKRTDARLWIVVGALPPAHLTVEPGDCARDALERYCQLMDDRIDAFCGSRGRVVALPRTQALAEILRKRLEILRVEIIPKAPATTVDLP